MERLTNSLVGTSDKLSEVMTHLESVIDKIDNGDGTAGKLVNDGRLYEQLLEDSKQLESGPAGPEILCGRVQAKRRAD